MQADCILVVGLGGGKPCVSAVELQVRKQLLLTACLFTCPSVTSIALVTVLTGLSWNHLPVGRRRSSCFSTHATRRCCLSVPLSLYLSLCFSVSLVVPLFLCFSRSALSLLLKNFRPSSLAEPKRHGAVAEHAVLVQWPPQPSLLPARAAGGGRCVPSPAAGRLRPPRSPPGGHLGGPRGRWRRGQGLCPLWGDPGLGGGRYVVKLLCVHAVRSMFKALLLLVPCVQQ